MQRSLSPWMQWYLSSPYVLLRVVVVRWYLSSPSVLLRVVVVQWHLSSPSMLLCRDSDSKLEDIEDVEKDLTMIGERASQTCMHTCEHVHRQTCAHTRKCIGPCRTASFESLEAERLLSSVKLLRRLHVDVCECVRLWRCTRTWGPVSKPRRVSRSCKRSHNSAIEWPQNVSPIGRPHNISPIERNPNISAIERPSTVSSIERRLTSWTASRSQW